MADTPTALSQNPNQDRNQDPNTTIGELRKQFGAHFAAPFQDSDTLGMLLAHSGANSLDEFLARQPK